MAVRYDFGTLGRAERTPGGGIRVPAHVSRVGVFPYRNADGSTRMEFRPPDEVFHADSLATLRDAAVTDLHPKEFVSPENWNTVSKGHASNPHQDSDKILAELIINDAALIAKIDARDRREVSCGYVCELDPTPGEHNGIRYDAVQRKIRYNHVAMGPTGWGRQGPEVAIHLDSNDDAVQTGSEAIPTEKVKVVEKETIDGIEYDVGSQAWRAAVRKRETEAIKRADEAEAKLAEATKRADTAEGEAKTLKERLAKAEDPARIDSLVKARTDAMTAAKPFVAADFDFSGKSVREIQVAALRADSKEFDDKDRSDDYVAGCFAGLCASRVDSHSARNETFKVPPQKRDDSTDETESAEDAYRAMIKRNAEASKGK